jgi:transcriptional regulator CtsR
MAEYMMHIISSMGDRISQQTAEVFINNFIDYKIILENEGTLMRAATSDKSLLDIPAEQRDEVRSRIFKHMLLSLTE